MKKIILFGTGERSENVLLQIDKTQYEVVEFWDNNNQKWNTQFAGKVVRKPHEDCEDIDKIVIASSFYEEIFNQLTKELGICPDKIANYLWFDKVDLLKYYTTHPQEVDNEIKEILCNLETQNLEVFNYEFSKKYKDSEIKIDYDTEVNLFYVNHNGKKMYMKRSLDTEQRVRNYYISLLIEQDEKSPHSYGVYTKNEKFDLLIDAGCAEGNFSLDNIEKAERILLIENDEEWLEALQYTFHKYREKVTVIDKYLSDYNSERNVSLNEILKQYNIDTKTKCLVKLDIEGAEEKAIIGGENMFKKMEDVTILTCTYHKKNSAKMQKALLEAMGLETECSKGYMFFPAEYERKTVTDIGNGRREPSLRRGLLIARKRICEKEDILDCYIKDYKVNYYSYNMMGEMLDRGYIKQRVEHAKIETIYIYGGGYLGIQLYHALKDLITIKAIVDKSGGICIEDETIPVISFEQMKKIYNGENIIITPIRYYSNIKKELMQFSVKEENILYLGEFLEGVL